MAIGAKQLLTFEASCPGGFYNALNSEIVTFATKK